MPAKPSTMNDFIQRQDKRRCHFISLNQMILKKQRMVDFTYSLHKILCIAPAYNNTFVLLGVIKAGMDEIILHIDKEGKQLYKFISKEPINVISMPNDRSVIFCENHQSKINVIDLRSHAIRSFSHDFIGDTTAAITMFFFSNTRFLAILERGIAKDHRLNITYYYTFSLNDEIIDQSLINDGQFNYNDVICKGNSDSMILWCRCRHKDTLMVYIYEVKSPKDKAGSLRMVEIRNSTLNKERLSSIHTVSNMWELSKNEIMLVSQIDQPGIKPDSRPCRVYILDIDKSVFRETAMPFDEYQPQVMIESFNLGQFSVFPTTKYKLDAQYMQTMLFFPNTCQEFIKPLTLKIHAPFNPMLPYYDKQTICIFQHENYRPRTFKALILKIATRKELFLQLLLHMNQDFDDDLLLDSMRLLCQQ